jgi:hypothetical protein
MLMTTSRPTTDRWNHRPGNAGGYLGRPRQQRAFPTGCEPRYRIGSDGRPGAKRARFSRSSGSGSGSGSGASSTARRRKSRAPPTDCSAPIPTARWSPTSYEPARRTRRLEENGFFPVLSAVRRAHQSMQRPSPRGPADHLLVAESRRTNRCYLASDPTHRRS